MELVSFVKNCRRRKQYVTSSRGVNRTVYPSVRSQERLRALDRQLSREVVGEGPGLKVDREQVPTPGLDRHSAPPLKSSHKSH